MITKSSFKKFIDCMTLITSIVSTLAMIDTVFINILPVNTSVLIAIIVGALYVMFARIKSEYEYWENKKLEE